MHDHKFIPFITVLCTILLQACGSIPGSFATPTPTATLKPVPTPSPPTITPSPAPTLTRTPAGPPTPTNQPRIVAEKRADVVGIWGTQLSDRAIRIEFRPDGTFDFDVVGPPGAPAHELVHVQEGIFRFVGENLILDSDRCAKMDPATKSYLYFRCQGTYKVYSISRGETPVLLSFVRVGVDPFVSRGNWFNNRTFGPARQ
jgi:hypothetical protein